MSKIRVADDYKQIEGVGGYRKWIAVLLAARWKTKPNWETAGSPLQASIIRSDWVVLCDHCREAVVAQKGQPYYCPNCQNAGNGGKARPVIFPENQAEIERVLLMRVNPDTRNWNPSETLADLIVENIEHGEWKAEEA